MNTGISTTQLVSERGMFGVDDFCSWAGISRATFYREVAAGRLVARKIGRKTVVPPTEANRWAEALPVVDRKLEAML